MSDNVFDHPRLKELLKKMADVAKKPYWDNYITIDEGHGRKTIRRAKSKEEYEKWRGSA